MAAYELSPATAADAPRLAEIQQAAFAEDPLTTAALANVSRADYVAWAARGLAHPDTPPGHRVETVRARDAATGALAGFARWLVPLAGDAATAPAPPREKPALPHGADEATFSAALGEIMGHHEHVMGARKRWTLLRIVVDPTLQRRGVGRVLIADGVRRAHEQGLPVLLSASPAGVPFYTALGFETKLAPFVESIQATMPVMISEPSAA